MSDRIKQLHDDLLAYGEKTRSSLGPIDAGSRLAIDTFLDALEDAEPFTAAHLVLLGYDLCGGTNETQALTAARAIQMTHVYTQFARKQQHATAQQGLHAALIMLTNMDAPDDLKIKLVSITNRSLLLFANALVSDDQGSPATLDCYVTESFLNPVHVGMVLAGANCESTDAITPFLMHAGRAQLSVDEKRAKTEHAHAEQAIEPLQRHWTKKELQPLLQILLPGYA